MNRPHPDSAHAGHGRLYRLAAGLLSGLLACLMLTGCGYVWRGQEGSPVSYTHLTLPTILRV